MTGPYGLLTRRTRPLWYAIVVLALVACTGGAAPTPTAIPIVILKPPGTPTPSAQAADAASPTPEEPTLSASSPTPETPTEPPPTPTPQPATQPPATTPAHIFLIVMSHQEFPQIVGNPLAPYLNQLVSQYALSEEYYAVEHPALEDYLALTSGHTFGLSQECTDCFHDEPSIADSLEAKGKSWKSYQEDLPQPCFLDPQAGNYRLTHNPFLYYTAIRDNPSRCQQVVPLTQLDADLASGTLPNFAWITPNLVHDMQDGNVASGDQWLASLVPRILNSEAWKQGGELYLTWDEGETNDGCCAVAEGGHVPLLIITPNGPPGYRSSQPATHYGLLRTIEDLWGLDRLGNSANPDVAPLWDLLSVGPSPAPAKPQPG
ncbi:MAG: alkaline phosphatase family protein [Thermomicrobia bacterium]|nr:alkaline phosphatase family protein [Thermomicrobia bacterium]MCA1724636.1 alkaline phosphatase family protein [Thermomicrobia bacterium]